MYPAGVRGRAYNTALVELEGWLVGECQHLRAKGSIAAPRGDGGFKGAETCAPCGLGDLGSSHGGDGWENEGKEVW